MCAIYASLPLVKSLPKPFYMGGTMSEMPEIPAVDPWDAFVIDGDAMEPEPEPGDFWGELDDDCDNRD